VSRKIALGAAVLLVPAYVAASWGLGRATHARFDAFEQEWNKQAVALFKVAERSYAPGVFSSEERITFELNDKIFGKIIEGEDARIEDVLFEGEEGAVEADEGSLSQANQPPRITVLHKIQHGPLPGFRSFGLARIESTLVLSDDTRAKIAKVLGDKEPLLVTTMIGMTGAGSSAITSPAFDIEEDGNKLSWKGFQGAFAYGRNMNSLECNLNAPGMAFTDQHGVNMQMGEISFDCNFERAFDDLYLGNAAFNIASMQYSKVGEKPMKIELVTYAGDIRKNGDYVDMGVKVGVGNMELEDFTMNDVHYDIAINHLHGPTYAAMQRKLQEGTAASALGDPTASLAVMGAIGEFLPQLLEHSPQLVIERIGFSMPEGEAGLKATLQLNNFIKDDMASGSSMALLGKLDASANIWFSEGLLMRDWAQRASDEMETSAPDKLARVRMQVAELEQQGYIQRKQNRLESHIEFKNGALTANGKPIGPMMGGM
jgi:uncharacterized protein YdgA (DUF945 family)